MERFLEPCLLLLLKQKAAHGYELIEKIHQLDFLLAKPDPGVVYRHLRRLEEEGLISSTWDTEGSGPAKKVYNIAKEADDYLRAWAEHIGATKAMLEGFLEMFQKEFPKS